MKQTTPAVVLALVWILIITIPAASDEGKIIYEARPLNEKMYLSNEVHGAIQIWNNSHFNQLAGAENWDGDGSESTPFIIDAYNITSDEIGIHIQDVTLYFVIRDCYLDSVTGIFSPGIFLSNVSHGIISGTTVTGKTVGIDIDLQSWVNIEGCTVFGCTNAAIDVYQSDNCRIDDCEFYYCGRGIQTRYTDSLTISNTEVHDNGGVGIYITESNFVTVTGGHTYGNADTGISFIGSHNGTISSHDCYDNADLATGVHFSSSDNATIIGNEFHSNYFVGVWLSSSNYATVQHNSFWNNSDIGLRVDNSQNCSIIDNDIWDNGFWPMSSYSSGIIVDSSILSVIEGNRIWNNSIAGIYLTSEADVNQIIDNLIYNNTDHGIYAYDAYFVDVVGNDIWGNGWRYVPTCGIYNYMCTNWLIEGNKIWNNTETGIRLTWGMTGGTTLILNNEILDNTGDGISLYGGEQDYVVDNNILHHNDANAIYFDLNSQVNITNNIVYDNLYGVNIVSSTPSWIFGNDIGWNLIENAADQSGLDNNYWHDSVSVGNWWSDYSGMGDYIITAFVGPGAYDIFPKKSLDLNASLPIAYEILETGNTMSWDAYALNPSHYEVYANDILLFSEEWDGGNIETNLDGLAAGNNDIMVIAYHVSGHSTNETATADVTDLTPPEWIITPIDQEITVGVPLSYQVSAEDPSGVSGYSLNDTVNFQISASGLISNAVDLAIGSYVLNVTVWDTFGNARSAIITVTVLAAPFWGDATIMLLIAAGGGAVILIVVVVTFLKKRK